MNDTKLKSSIFNEDSQNFNKNSLDIYSYPVNNDSLFSHQNHTQLSSQDICPISNDMYTKYKFDHKNMCVVAVENFCKTKNIQACELTGSLFQVKKNDLKCNIITENEINDINTYEYFKPIITAGVITGLTLLGKEFLSYCYDSVKKRFNYVKEVFVSWYKTNCQKEKQLNQDEKRLEESKNKTRVLPEVSEQQIIQLPEISEQCLVQEPSSLSELSQNLRMNKKTELVKQPVAKVKKTNIFDRNNRFSSLSQTQTQKEIEEPKYLKQLENLIDSNEYNNKKEFEKISILENKLTSYKEAGISDEELLQVKNYIWELLNRTIENNGKSKPMFRNSEAKNELCKIIDPNFQEIVPVSTNIESNPYEVEMVEVDFANIHSIREKQDEQLDEVIEEHAKGEDDLDYFTFDTIATKKTLKGKREAECIENNYNELEEDYNEAEEGYNELEEDDNELEEGYNEAEENADEFIRNIANMVNKEQNNENADEFMTNLNDGFNDKIDEDEAILDFLLDENVSLTNSIQTSQVESKLTNWIAPVKMTNSLNLDKRTINNLLASLVKQNVSLTNSIQTSQVESVADSCIANIQKLGSKSQEDSLITKKELVYEDPLYTYINNITNEVRNLTQKDQLNTEEIAILNDFKGILQNQIKIENKDLKEIIKTTIEKINTSLYNEEEYAQIVNNNFKPEFDLLTNKLVTHQETEDEGSKEITKEINTSLYNEEEYAQIVHNFNNFKPEFDLMKDKLVTEEDYKKYKLDRLDKEADEAVMFNQSQADQKGMVRAVVQNIKNKMPNQDKLKKYASISDLVRDIQGLDSDTIMRQLDIIVKEVNDKINLLSSSRQDISKSQKIIDSLQTTEQNLKTILKTVSEKKLSDKAIITITKACAACNFNKNNAKNIIVNTDNAGNATNVKNFPVSFKSDKSVTLGLDMKTSNDQILENGNRTFKAEILNTSSEEFNDYTKDKNICLNFTFSPKIDMITFIKNSRSIGFCKGYDLTMDNNSKPTSSIDKCKKMEELLKNLSEIIKISEGDKSRELIEFLKVNPKDREFIETFEKELMTNLATEYEITPKKITKLEDLTQIISQIQKMEEAKAKAKEQLKEQQKLEEQRQLKATQKALEALEVENQLIF